MYRIRFTQENDVERTSRPATVSSRYQQ